MIRIGFAVSALAAVTLVGTAPAQASVELASVGGVINQLHNNSHFDPSTMTFTICQNGRCQTLFTGLAGLHNYTDLAGFNAWAGTGNVGGAGGYFDNYKPTYSAVTSFFGNQTPQPQVQSFTYLAEAPAIPEPATWAMMIGGFALVGAAMRRRRATAVSFS